MTHAGIREVHASATVAGQTCIEVRQEGLGAP